VFVEPEPPKGLGSVFGGKKKHAAAVAAAREAFEAEHRAWEAEAAKVPALQLKQIQKRDAHERRRVDALQAAREAYDRECAERDAEAARANQRLDALIAGLAAGEHEAVLEYVGIVLGNSVYPQVLAVEHDYEFDPDTRELSLTTLVSPPDQLPAEKSYRWVKAKDEVIATLLSRKDLKERYASIVHQVALRTLHEIFEADRAARIQTITLHVATETKDPATGLESRVVFVGVGAERDSFMTFDLHNIVPAATLEHLGAAMSKNPHELVGVDGAPGVRGR
jgi:restriction system protein